MRFLAVVLGIALLSYSAAALSEREYQSKFTSFMTQYAKEYEHDEFFNRYAVFKQNFNIIQAHNMGNHSYTLGVNQFADMTSAEFKAKMTGLNAVNQPFLRSQNEVSEETVVAPNASFDWRTKGAVNAIKNQEQCGSCWAFSAIASAEGAIQIKSGTLYSLSEQQLVDCSDSYGNQGCNGGWMDYGFEYIIGHKGIASEAAYPYKAVDQACKTVASTSTISSYVDVAANNEAAILTAVNKVVVSIAVEADQAAWQFYAGGVLDDTSCGTTLDHGVAIVGYGTDVKDYWIVRNSWGTTWGEAGYIRLVRNKNQCGLASVPSYAVA
jgi:C1A family cysteine protease